MIGLPRACMKKSGECEAVTHKYSLSFHELNKLHCLFSSFDDTFTVLFDNLEMAWT